jgi:colicin import membrane protein
MASNKYYYQVLGVQSNASQDEIKQAFHQLAHKYHPDISTEPNAEQKFQDINEAYTALKHQKPVNKKRSKLPIIAAIVGIISLVATMIFFNQNSLNAEEIQTGILNHNSEAISNLENANINIAQQVILGTTVKVALIDFYLKNPPLWNKLDSYHHSIRTEILKDDQVYHRLRDHYYHQIDNEIKEDKFKKALPLLGELKKAYPKKSELFDKYQQIQEKKQQRLAALTQKYMDCLYKTWVPLLERTHCMAAARDTIETVGIEHELPTDANLPAMYAKEVRLALKDQNYDHADDILLDWEKLLPAHSEQRDVLKDILYLRRERDNIIADLSGNDKMQIAKRLHQLSADPILQEQVLEIPNVKRNLLKYKFNELLTIIASNYGDVSPSHESKLREILDIPEEQQEQQEQDEDKDDTTTQIASASTTTPTIPIAIPIQSNTSEVEQNNTTKVNNLLIECKRLYNKNYLTRGKRTALSCYRDILKIEPNNNQALDGINNIENKYYVWADNNLRKKKFGRVKYYIQALQKFNSNSSRLTSLKQKLNTAQQTAVAQANETTKAKEAARLARLKATREKAVKERETRLKAAREAKRAARLKAAKEKAAEERAARRASRKKAAEEIKAARLASKRKAAEERRAARRAARKKAAEKRRAVRLAAKRKAAEERRAAKRAARKKAAEERRAARRAAKRKAAEERRAARRAAKRKAAEKRRAARRAAKRKAAEERRAARRAAKRKAAEKRRAARRAAKRKAAEKRRAARLAAKRKAAEKRRAARLAAKRKAAEERRAARLAAKRKAAKERKAARLAAKRKAAKKRRAVKAKRRKRGGSCSKLVRQMSMGIKPLTSRQRAYFRRNCR